MEKYFFFGLLLLTLLFAFLIFRPFWAVLVLGISFSIVLYPVYEWFRKRKLPNWLASLLTVFFFIIVLCLPLLFVGTIVFNQSQNVYHVVTESGSLKPFIENLNDSINSLLPADMVFDVGEKSSEFVSFLSRNVAKIFTATLSAFFSFILMLLAIFYFLKDGARWKKAIVLLSPLTDKDDEKIISRLTLSINGVIKGYLLVAIIQGTLMGLGLWIFGVPNPALWGVLAAIASLLPTIGTALVSVPAIIYLLIVGSTAQAVGLLIWAALAVGMVDNFLNPIIVGGKINIPSLLVLFSVLGGISVLGPIGILVGPLTVSLLYALISIYRNEFQQNIISS
jgi:predicted PurR-regulated permease PerM